MFPNCTDCFGCQKNKQNNKEQTKKKQGKKYIKTGNNSTYHEPLSEEYIGRRS